MKLQTRIIFLSLWALLLGFGGHVYCQETKDAAALFLVATLKGHTDQVRQVAFSPDGKIIASCSHDKSVTARHQQMPTTE